MIKLSHHHEVVTHSMHYIATSENVVVEVADLMRAGDGFKFNS